MTLHNQFILRVYIFTMILFFAGYLLLFLFILEVKYEMVIIHNSI